MFLFWILIFTQNFECIRVILTDIWIIDYWTLIWFLIFNSIWLFWSLELDSLYTICFFIFFAFYIISIIIVEWRFTNVLLSTYSWSLRSRVSKISTLFDWNPASFVLLKRAIFRADKWLFLSIVFIQKIFPTIGFVNYIFILIVWLFLLWLF